MEEVRSLAALRPRAFDRGDTDARVPRSPDPVFFNASLPQRRENMQKEMVLRSMMSTRHASVTQAYRSPESPSPQLRKLALMSQNARKQEKQLANGGSVRSSTWARARATSLIPPRPAPSARVVVYLRADTFQL